MNTTTRKDNRLLREAEHQLRNRGQMRNQDRLHKHRFSFVALFKLAYRNLNQVFEP